MIGREALQRIPVCDSCLEQCGFCVIQKDGSRVCIMGNAPARDRTQMNEALRRTRNGEEPIWITLKLETPKSS